jgi:apolipoprotein N-acyltransferase
VRPEFSATTHPGRLLNYVRLLLAPFALGATTVLGFAPFQFYFVPPATLAVLLLLWLPCHTVRTAAVLGFAFGAGMFLAGVSWIYVSLHDYGGMLMPVAALFTLLFCLVLACFPALACAIASRLRARTPVRLMLLFPALWAVLEWARGWVLSGFPWLAIGYSQSQSPELRPCWASSVFPWSPRQLPVRRPASSTPSFPVAVCKNRAGRFPGSSGASALPARS